MTRFGELLRALAAASTDYIIVGGAAAVAHGAARATQDLDILYRRSSDNLRKLVEAIGPLHPTLRDAPPGLPFSFDLPTLRSGLNINDIARLA